MTGWPQRTLSAAKSCADQVAAREVHERRAVGAGPNVGQAARVGQTRRTASVRARVITVDRAFQAALSSAAPSRQAWGDRRIAQDAVRPQLGMSVRFGEQV